MPITATSSNSSRSDVHSLGSFILKIPLSEIWSFNPFWVWSTGLSSVTDNKVFDVELVAEVEEEEPVLILKWTSSSILIITPPEVAIIWPWLSKVVPLKSKAVPSGFLLP